MPPAAADFVRGPDRGCNFASEPPQQQTEAAASGHSWEAKAVSAPGAGVWLRTLRRGRGGVGVEPRSQATPPPGAQARCGPLAVRSQAAGRVAGSDVGSGPG